jgi:hypothetical protein
MRICNGSSMGWSCREWREMAKMTRSLRVSMKTGGNGDSF